MFKEDNSRKIPKLVVLVGIEDQVFLRIKITARIAQPHVVAQVGQNETWIQKKIYIEVYSSSLIISVTIFLLASNQLRDSSE